MKRFLLALVLPVIFLAACAKTVPTPPSNPEQLWQSFCAPTEKAPYRIDLSLRLGKTGDTRRVTALLWGNDTKTLRMDVSAGVGAILAKIRTSPNSFLLVAPTEGKAYTHRGTNQPRLKLGIPLPLTLQDIAALLTGASAEVFGKHYEGSTPRDNGHIRYTLTGPLNGTLDLDATAKPVSWNDPKGWTMDLLYDENNRLQKLSLSNKRDERFIVFVKGLEHPAAFTTEQLSLAVPPGIRLLPLEKYAQRNTVDPSALE